MCNVYGYYIFSSWCAHWSPLANILCGVVPIITRATISNLLPPMELGSLFAMLEILVSLIPFLISPLATWLYNITLDTCPGIILVLKIQVFTDMIIFFVESWALVCVALNTANFLLLLTVHVIAIPKRKKK